MTRKKRNATDERSGPYPLLFVNVELTLRCNLKCLHCGSTAGTARPRELESKEWLSVMEQLAELGCREVCVLGGEPFVNRHWFEIASSICDLDMNLVLITNGWLIRPELVKRLSGLKRLDRIGVSLDGATQETHDRIRGRKGSFARVKEALFMLRDAGFETGAITSVSRLNLDELVLMREMLAGQEITWQLQTVMGHGERWSTAWNLTPEQNYQVAEFIADSRAEYGVDVLPIAGSHGFGYNSTRLSGYAERDEWPGCLGGRATLGIMSSGQVKPCLSQPDSMVVGDLTREPLSTIWKDDERFRRNRLFSIDMLTGFCRECPHASVCQGGCPNLPFTTSGSDSDNEYCLYRLEQQDRVPPNALKEGFLP